MTKDYAYQDTAELELRRAYTQGFRRIMLQAPTGAGKTKIADRVIKGALAKGQRVAFTVPMISLIDQTYEKFVEAGIPGYPDMAIIQADHPMTNYAAPLQICSQATLTRRTSFPDVNICIVDEAHIVSRFVYRWMKMRPDTLFIGLSATPWTKGLGKHYDKLVVVSTTQELIDDGYLSPFRVFAPSAPDLANIKTVGGDYEQQELGRRVSKQTLVSDIVSTYLDKGQGLPTICYAVNRAHAKLLFESFLSSGVSAAYIDANTPLEDREVIRQQFHSGDVDVVCNVGCLTMGVDWDVRCIILARPTKSEMLFTQMVGRGLRLAEGKQDCLILDHSDTHNRLGFVTDICYTNLDQGEVGKKPDRKKPEFLPKPCPKCAFVKEVGVRECPQCGFLAEPQAHVDTKEGELVELKPGKKTFSTQEKEEIWAMLAYYAEEKGFKEGWIWWTCKEMIGSAPRYRDAPRVEPNSMVRNFIKYKQIKNAKSKKSGNSQRPRSNAA